MPVSERRLGMQEYVCISTAATVKKITENVKKLPKTLRTLIFFLVELYQWYNRLGTQCMWNIV